MIFRFGLIVLLATILSNPLFAVLITGKVSDAITGEPIPYANVFLANTTIGTLTDFDGNFQLNTSLSGFQQLIVSHLSYKSLATDIQLSTDISNLRIQLKPNTHELSSITVQGKKSRFKRRLLVSRISYSLLSSTRNAEACTIENPDVIRTETASSVGEANEDIIAYSDSFIVISNKVLAYKLKYKLDHFERSSNNITFHGFPLFEDVIKQNPKKEKVEKLRKLAYQGSKMHFFRSLYNNSLQTEGFVVYKINEEPCQDWDKAGFLSDPNIVQTIGFCLVQTSEPIDLYQYVKTDSISGSKILEYSDAFEIQYLRSAEEPKYTISPQYHKGIKRTFGIQTSLVKLNYGHIKFSKEGACGSNIYALGYWGWKRLADILPYDYVDSTSVHVEPK